MSINHLESNLIFLKKLLIIINFHKNVLLVLPKTKNSNLDYMKTNPTTDNSNPDYNNTNEKKNRDQTQTQTQTQTQITTTHKKERKKKETEIKKFLHVLQLVLHFTACFSQIEPSIQELKLITRTPKKRKNKLSSLTQTV